MANWQEEENTKEQEETSKPTILAETAGKEEGDEGKNPYETGVFKDSEKKKNKRVKYCLAALGVAVCSFLSGMLVSQLTIDSELRSLARLKNRIQKSYYEEVTDEEFYAVLFEAVNENLLDDYSWYMDSQEYAQSRTEATGEQSGLGIVFRTETANGGAQMLVSRVCGNSPAEAKGIKAGDYVIGFGASETEITDSVVFDQFSTFLGGYEAGEEFCLKLRSNGETKVVSIAKAVYVENYVFYRTDTQAFRFSGEDALDVTEEGEPLSCLPTDTAYIRLTKFNGEAAEEFAEAMKLFREHGKKNLVLDLRGNGGGYLHIMQEISAYFCKGATGKKPLVAVADYGEEESKFYASGNYYDDYFAADSRICVLADSDTASASECLIGCMLDYGSLSYEDICLAERNGVAKTYGKGIMQTTYPLGGLIGDAVKLTTARICWPLSRTCIHGEGILPSKGARTVAEDIAGDGEIVGSIGKLFP